MKYNRKRHIELLERKRSGDLQEQESKELLEYS